MNRRPFQRQLLARIALAGFAAVGAAVSSGPAGAAPSVGSKVGNLSRVGQDPAVDSKGAPAVSLSPSGETAIAWPGTTTANLPPDGVYLRSPMMVLNDGQARINSNVTSPIAVDVGSADGRTAVVWTDGFENDLAPRGIYLRCEGPTLPSPTKTTVVLLPQDALEDTPRVAMDDSGNIVVAWTQDAENGYEVRVRRYDGDCVPKGPSQSAYVGDVRINSVDVDMGHQGGYVLVWSTRDQYDDQDAVMARRFNGEGGDLTPLIEVAGPVLDKYFHARVAASKYGGHFIVVWERESDADLDRNVHFRRYDFNQIVSGVANGHTTGDQVRPAVARDGDGNTVIVWEGPGSSGPGIYGKRFLKDGTMPVDFRVDAPQHVNSHHPAIGMDRDGDFVVAWEAPSTTNHTDIYMQRFAGFNNVDLSAVITVEPTSDGEVNSPMDYQVTLTNQHAPNVDPAVGVATRVTLDTTSSNGTVSPVSGADACTSLPSGTLRCLVARQAAGSARNVGVKVLPTTAGQVQLTAEVTAEQYDADAADDQDIESTPVGPDATPDNLLNAFTDKVVRYCSVRAVSNRVRLSGFTAPAPISLENNAEAEYQVNYRRFTRAPGVVQPGDSVRLRMRPGTECAAQISVKVRIGRASDTWIVQGRP